MSFWALWKKTDQPHSFYLFAFTPTYQLHSSAWCGLNLNIKPKLEVDSEKYLFLLCLLFLLAPRLAIDLIHLLKILVGDAKSFPKR